METEDANKREQEDKEKRIYQAAVCGSLILFFIFCFEYKTLLLIPIGGLIFYIGYIYKTELKDFVDKYLKPKDTEEEEQ